MVVMEPSDSSRISELGYDADAAIVYVVFRDTGIRWRYSGVPEYVWQEFRSAPSQGKFIHDVLDHYDHGPG